MPFRSIGRGRLPLLAVAVAALALAACQVQPPVSFSARESAVEQGMVITVTNTSEEFLHDVTIAITAPSGEVKKHFLATLKPHESENVGWLKLEGWPIPEGSDVSVSSKGFLRPISWKVTI